MTDKKTKPIKDNTEVLKNQVVELREALLRERADAMNVRRRAEEDKTKMSSFFKASVISELLPFIDNFNRAMEHTPQTEDSAVNEWLKGLSGVEKQLIQALDQIGLKKIKTTGEIFDPKLHEAVSMDDTKGGNKEVVVEEFNSGYVLGDEVLRPAMVKVATE